MVMSMNRRHLLGLAVVASIVPPLSMVRAQTGSLVIFAAASLKNALDEIAADWSKASGKPVPKISYAASGPLAKQIEQGAPADLFISADLDWMDYVDKKDLIRKDTRVNLLGNRLVLVAPADSKVSIDIKPGFDLVKALNGGRLAMGDPASVPAGKYGLTALQKLGVWDGVKDKTANAESVRAALALVARGEAPLGIVYSTDATPDKTVKIVGTFPEDSHPPIVYPAAVIKDSKAADAVPFLAYMKSLKARPAFEKQGFTVLVKSNSAT